jgi:hypothetical protein
MQRTAAERRHHRDRLIHKRMSIALTIDPERAPWLVAGKYDKRDSFDCGHANCLYCRNKSRWEKRVDFERLLDREMREIA